MLFNSYQFILIFLPVTLIGFFLISHFVAPRWGKKWLILCSLVFYGYWNVIYVPLLVGSLVFNFCIARLLLQRQRKSTLIIGLVANIILLGFFKYYDFFIQNLDVITGASFPLLHILLPLGISFITFQKIAYLVDSYRGITKGTSFQDFTLFVLFFPQLIAGPIVHHAELIPQFKDPAIYKHNWDNISKGLYRFTIGLAKKVIIADTFAQFANAGFSYTGDITLFAAWGAVLSYTLQIYFDFSGYTDMALGAAKMLNINLPDNFNSPYKAQSIQDFWRRWHMTLSRFLRDYIYIPLGGNRNGEAKLIRNTLIVFLVGGLWHGANWTFVIWGALHGVAAGVQHLWSKGHKPLPPYFARILTFVFVCFAWIFFRAETFESAFKIIKGSLGLNGVALPNLLAGPLSALLGSLANSPVLSFGNIFTTIGAVKPLNFCIYIVAGLFIAFILPNSQRLAGEFKPKVWSAIAMTALFIACFYSMNSVSAFIYFNF